MESDLEVLRDRLSPLPGGERSNNNLAIPSAARPSRLGSPIQPAVALMSELMEPDRLRPPPRAASTRLNGQIAPPPRKQISSNPEGTLAQEEPPQTHYTISEDEVGGSRDMVEKLAMMRVAQMQQLEQQEQLEQEQLDERRRQRRKEQQQQEQIEQEQLIERRRQEQMALLRAAQQVQDTPQMGYMRQLMRAAPAAAAEEKKVAARPEAQWTRSVPTNRMLMSAPLNAASTYRETGGGFATTVGAPSPPPPDTNLAQSESMLEYIQSLEAQLGLPKTRLELCSASAINIQVFHCLGDRNDPDTYLAEPKWLTHDDKIMLRGYFPVHDAGGYIEKKGNIAFAVYKHYTVEHQKSEVERAMKANEPLPSPQPAYQDVELISGEMAEAVKAFIAQHPTFCTELLEPDNREVERWIMSPHIWWYHCRKRHKTQDLPPRQANMMTALTDWVEASFGSLYDGIDHQFCTGRVSGDSIEYLVHPGQVLVLKDDGGGIPMGYLATARPKLHSNDMEGQREEQQQQSLWAVDARSYSYAGEFFRTDQTITLGLESNASDGEVNIADLKAVPLQYAGDEIKEVLERRGKTFWKCRSKCLVSYETATNSKDKKHVRQRFMTDFATYKELHPENPCLQSMSLQKNSTFGLGLPPRANLPTNGSEPAAPDIYLFPGHLPGFDLRRKKWVNLEVDRIRDVAWNDQAFQSLVADEDMKELVLALVTNQLTSETATDLIDSKGNGLIMLLHGSPGTGKTFTAESVAEIARKPLYSVTCGDIGTEPEVVEQYLAKVFNLGKIWDCVVLLDEAEVFLEQRTLQDLKRNALVSVFLRQLEYYEGILILTTNRVGTFDEAFKSRIQLALRYEPLGRDQRKQVWRNFLHRLRALGEGDSIDFSEITSHMDELAGYEMNGREIRNSITTGRQLAKYMKEKMTFGHLKRAIGVTEKFDRYLAEVREREADADDAGGRGADGRFSADYFARVDGTR